MLSGYNGYPDTRCSGNDATDELARGGALLMPSAIPCSLSYPLLSFLGLEAYCLHLHSSTQQVPWISTEELVLPRHARSVLSRLGCNGHSLLGSYLCRIGRIKSPSCRACGTRHFSSHSALSSCGFCAAHSLPTLYPFTISGPGPE